VNINILIFSHPWLVSPPVHTGESKLDLKHTEMCTGEDTSQGCEMKKSTSILSLNWNYSIIIVFVLFAGFILTMVYFMTSEKIDLVREDYYQKELEFQKQIKKSSNTANLKTKVAMTYLPESEQLNIFFPTRVVNGEVKFFRPSDKRMDVDIPLKSLPENPLHLSTQKLHKGYWKVQVTWTDGVREYFNEQELFI
jgi:nitrogen fixation protein FixH